MRFTIFQESRKGSRKVNQDRIAYTYSRDTLLLVVADGMGGHRGGATASREAVASIGETFERVFRDSEGNGSDAPDPGETLV